MEGVLKQKRSDDDGESKPPPVHQKADTEGGQRHRCGIRFQSSFDVPFAVELHEPLLDGCWATGRNALHMESGLPLNSRIDFLSRALLNAQRGWQEGEVWGVH